MAETNPPSFKFDEEKVAKHLESVIAYQETFAGKPGHNPYSWIAKHVRPLTNRLHNEDKPERTKELQEAILALPIKDTPPIAKGSEHNAKNPPIEHQASGRSANAGQFAGVQGQVIK